MSEAIGQTDKIHVKYATGDTDRGKVVNHREPWSAVWPLFLSSQRGYTTTSEYRDFDQMRQAREKMAPGFFIGCSFRGEQRKRDQIVTHQFITLDIDECTREIGQRFKRNEIFPGIEHVVHSTRSHAPDKIKVHVIIPLAKSVNEDDWHAATRIAASMVDPTMMAIDVVSYRPAQIMYFPSHNSDVTPIKIHNRGRMLRVDEFLLDWDGDANDIGSLPKSPREEKIRVSELKAENPLDKRGIVGAFCRAFDIHETIAMLDPPKYEPSQTNETTGEIERYSYLGGKGHNGAIVYRHDGIATKLHSHHGTDPVSALGQVNAFDLYRLHMFGDLDDWRDGKKEDPRELKSYKAMERAIREGDEFQAIRDEILSGRYGDAASGFDSEDDPEASTAPVEGRPEGREIEDDGLGGALDGPVEAPESTPDGAAALGAVSTRRSPAPPPRPTSPPDGADWRDKLALTEKLTIRKTLDNVVRILRNARTTAGRLVFDEFAQTIVCPYGFDTKGVGRIAPNSVPSRATMEEVHRAHLQHLLSSPGGPGLPGWSLEVAKDILNTAIIQVAEGQDRRYHPVTQWFADLPTWDGVARVKNLLSTVCHIPSDPYLRDVARHFMTGMVARVMEPGCKFDYMVILEGKQGRRKSTFLRNLAPWPALYANSDGHFDEQKKFIESTRGRLLIEIDELNKFRLVDIRAIKSTLSREYDGPVRLAFRRDEQTFARACILTGSTNDRQYLRDEDNRRFWPVKINDNAPLDLDWLEANHAQIWAEALHLYREMLPMRHNGDLPFYLEGESRDIAERLQADKVIHTLADDDAALAAAWLENPVPRGEEKCGYGTAFADAPEDDGLGVEMVLRDITCAQEIWERAISGGGGAYDERAQRRVAHAMNQVPGWTSERRGPLCGKYGRPRVYRRVK